MLFVHEHDFSRLKASSGGAGDLGLFLSNVRFATVRFATVRFATA